MCNFACRSNFYTVHISTADIEMTFMICNISGARRNGNSHFLHPIQSASGVPTSVCISFFFFFSYILHFILKSWESFFFRDLKYEWNK